VHSHTATHAATHCTTHCDILHPTLRHTATHCNRPQHAATLAHIRRRRTCRKHIVQRVVHYRRCVNSRTATHAATHCITHCDTLQSTATQCSTPQHTASLSHIRREGVCRVDTIQRIQPTLEAMGALTHCNTHCNTLQHTATYHNTLQHTATPASTRRGRACRAHIIQRIQPTLEAMGALARTATHTITRCHTPQHTATHRKRPQHTAAHCNTCVHSALTCVSSSHHIAYPTYTRGDGCTRAQDLRVSTRHPLHDFPRQKTAGRLVALHRSLWWVFYDVYRSL